MDIAIIGAGLIGKKRARALPKGVRLRAVCDIDRERALKFSEEFQCDSETNWRKTVADPLIEAVIIATPNKHLSVIAAAAIARGKHVLVEKPGAKNLKELQKIIAAYCQRKVVVMFGYNHRYHAAIEKAKKIVDSKKYGKVLFIRAKYGHGGRLGYEKEWRFNEDLAGGGELLDQGTHLIDLVNFFCGALNYHSSYLGTLFWRTKLEDSSFVILKGDKTAANLSATCVEWKNLFCFEIMLESAKIQIDGLGRSYGTEKLTLYVMSPEMGPPKVTEFNFPGEDLSWKKENEVFFKRIRSRDFSEQALRDAQYVLSIISKTYAKK
ncbi:MAG: Gfo/Idh/MocA family oxidoreductase [Candidatus Taylorbacteria bacterium]|nr:Gfo/Idh/MocA family oxidoreductase [Candidatus Taylorbacteria bacterium]